MVIIFEIMTCNMSHIRPCVYAFEQCISAQLQQHCWGKKDKGYHYSVQLEAIMKTPLPNFLISWKRAQPIASGENSVFFLCCCVDISFYLQVGFHNIFFYK